VLIALAPGSHQGRCDGCARVSPVLPGTPEDARAKLVELGWFFARDGAASCTICMNKKTTKRSNWPPKQ